MVLNLDGSKFEQFYKYQSYQNWKFRFSKIAKTSECLRFKFCHNWFHTKLNDKWIPVLKSQLAKNSCFFFALELYILKLSWASWNVLSPLKSTLFGLKEMGSKVCLVLVFKRNTLYFHAMFFCSPQERWSWGDWKFFWWFSYGWDHLMWLKLPQREVQRQRKMRYLLLAKLPRPVHVRLEILFPLQVWEVKLLWESNG